MTANLVELGLEEFAENEFVFKAVTEVQVFFSDYKNCTCYRHKNSKDLQPCFEKIGFKPFFKRFVHLKALNKSEKDLFIKTQLMIGKFSNNNDDDEFSDDDDNNNNDEDDENNNSKKSRTNYRYNFNASSRICINVFIKLCGVSKKVFDNIKKHYKKFGLDERIHKNTGRVPGWNSKTKITEEISISVNNFLINYAIKYGLPSPMRSSKNTDVYIYLETDKTYTSVYNDYKENYLNEFDGDVISYTSFCRLWKQLMPHLKFQPLATDMCDTCTDFKAQLKYRANEANFEVIRGNYEEHKRLAELERDYFVKNIEKANNYRNVSNILYDFAQNVTIPHLPQQPGSIYFKSGYKVHIFGVCRTDRGTNIQLNYLIGEDELPKGTSKGSNTTLNMVYHSLNRLAQGGIDKLQITCDNCGAQNKNNLSLWFWCWLVMIGRYKEISVNFMIPGHTKFHCDGFFGNIKKKYKSTKINTINDIEDVINTSAVGNSALLFKKEPEWKWYDFQSFFDGNFNKLPYITQYYHFRFSKILEEDIGKIYLSVKAGGEETCFQLLKLNINFDPNKQLTIIPVAPLSKDRKEYLYKNLRQYVEGPFKDIHFPKP